MKNLTVRYGVTQVAYWAAYSGTASFAATYLLGRGLSSGAVGVLLAAGGLLSCASQPLLASYADHSRKFMLTKMLLLMSAVCCGCFGALLIPGLPMAAVGLFYMAAIWSSDAMVPLLNALNVAYDQAGYTINYGVGRGLGSAASGLSAMAFGFIIAKFGTTWMILILVSFRILSMIAVAGYPRIQKLTPLEKQTDTSCSMFQFFFRYPWYSVSLLGVLLLAMYHAMTENYLIAIMNRLGGDSSHVGVALFISAITASPVLFFFNNVRKVMKDSWIFKIAALSFLLKSVLFYFARSITAIYIFQLIQITSYAFLSPIQLYYARAKILDADMVKGQAFITAAYALGCSAGNFAGGQILALGVDALLFSGILMALFGTIIVFFTVNRTDITKP